jgi:hypothetical protein
MKTNPIQPTWQVDGFGAAVRSAAAPLLIWALHFALLYVGIAAGCWARADRVAIGGGTLLGWLIAAATIPVAIWLGWVAWSSARRLGWLAGSPARQIGDGAGSASTGAAAGAVIALIAVTWETVPMLVLPLCER